MGAKPVHEKTLNSLMKKWESFKFLPLHNKFVSAHTMRFRTDWNWLMPVVNKLKLNITGIEDKNLIVDLCYEEIIKLKNKKDE